MNTYKEREERIKAAIALEPVDKVPVISGAAAITSQLCGVKMSDFISDMELNCTTNIKATEMMGNIDGIQTPLATPDFLRSGCPGLKRRAESCRIMSCGR